MATCRARAGGSQVAYDFNVTRAGAVTAVVTRLAARTGGFVTFDVDIDSGIAVGTVIPNSARFLFYDESGAAGWEQSSEPATYLVTGKSGLEIKGQHLGTVTPGAVATFTNVLTNRGDAPTRSTSRSRAAPSRRARPSRSSSPTA